MDRKLCKAAVVVGSGAANADAASATRTATRENMVQGMIVVLRWVECGSDGVGESVEKNWRLTDPFKSADRQRAVG